MSPIRGTRRSNRSMLRISGLLAAVFGLIAGAAIAATPASATALAITAVTPTSGTTQGGQSITITGAGFSETDISVLFTDPVSSYSTYASGVVVSGGGTSLTAVTPVATAGNYTVSVIIDGDNYEQVDLAGAYTYTCNAPTEPLTVSTVSGDYGSYLGGGFVSIYGTGFACDSSVTIDGVAATIRTRVGNDEIDIITPASTSGIGDVDVVVTNGTPPGSVTVPNGYTYTALSAITPYGSSSAGGTNMRIYGYGFTNSTTVTIGGIAASVTRVSSSRLDIVTPAVAAGEQPLVVATPGIDPETWDGAFGVSDPISVTCSVDSDTTMDPSLNGTVLLQLDSSCTHGNFTEIGSVGTSTEEPSITWVDRYKLQYLSQAMYGWYSPVVYTAGPAQGTDVVEYTDGTHTATLRFRVGGPIPAPPAPAPAPEPIPSVSATPATPASSAPVPILIPVTASQVPPATLPPSMPLLAGGSAAIIDGQAVTCATTTTRLGTTTACGTPPTKLYCNAGAVYTGDVQSRALAPGLYVQVIDGLVSLANTGGSQTFTAGQFGFTPSLVRPPVIVPANPGIQFTPPPAFSGTSGTSSSSSGTTVDCQVRSRSGMLAASKAAEGADVAQGGVVLFRMGGVLPNSPVSVYLNASTSPVGNLRADATGEVDGWVRIPKTTSIGTNSLQIAGVIRGNRPVNMFTGITVRAAKTSSAHADIPLDSTMKYLPATTKKSLRGLLSKVPGTTPARCVVTGQRTTAQSLANEFLAQRGLKCAQNVRSTTSGDSHYAVRFAN